MMGLLKKRRIILGIDPGYGITGFGVVKFVGDKPEPLDYGCITTPKDEDLGIRLSMIQEDLFYLLEKYRPDIVAIENLYFCKNVKTAIDVGQARGIILLEATRFKVPILEFTPTQVKMAVAGYGRASKQQIQKMMQTLLSLPSIPKPDDAADALALAVCCGYTSLNLMKIVDSEFKSKPAEDGVKKSKNLKIKKTKKTTKKVAASKKPKKVTIKKSKKESKVKPKKVVKKKK